MAPAKRLNLSKSRDDDASSSASSSGDEHESQTNKQTPDSDDSGTDDDSDEEFEIPPGFERVKGSAAVTREAVLASDQELWFFKLPKHLDASALADVTFKLDPSQSSSAGEAVAKVAAAQDGKKYVLQSEDTMLTDQLVNALPLAADRTRFVLGKPFSRCFSLVEDHRTETTEDTADKTVKTEKGKAASPVSEKRKKHSGDKHKASKKHKHKK